MKSNYILIIGPPASGKSTLSKLLSQSLHFSEIDLDSFITAEKKSSGIGTGDQVPPEIILHGLDKQKRTIDMYLLKNKGVIASSTYHDIEYQLEMFRKTHPRPIIFVLDAGLEFLLMRNSRRSSSMRTPESYVRLCFRCQRSFLSRKDIEKCFNLIQTDEATPEQCIKQIMSVISPQP